MEKVKECVERGEDINYKIDLGKEYPSLLIRYFAMALGDTPLKAAMNYGHLEVIKYLVEQGADTSFADINYWVSANWIEKVQECINNGESVNKEYRDGSYYTTPLIMACIRKNKEMIDLLLSHGADINNKYIKIFNKIHKDI